jgi:oxygen-independent coproporphyrinogen-3 oxidase
LIKKYDRPGPRYTSYPTAVEFSESYGPAQYEEGLAQANQDSDAPLSLYFHLPFCEARCAFCACNVIITSRHDTSVCYLEYLEKEIELIARHLPDRRKVAQLHFGGGTPTFQTPGELRRLFGAIASHFEILPNAEIAIEVDPCVTTEDHLRTIAELGFNRLSMGVQDLAPEVQKAIRRNQTYDQTKRLFDLARESGIRAINVDLIYGLPLQRTDSFAKTIEQIIELRPGRVALYSFAHLPSLRHNQKLLDTSQLPLPETKLQLFVGAIEAFLAAGYSKIGMDHFAAPDDELARAQSERKLYRNFMGYTVRPTNAAIGFGVSSIGELQGDMMQNSKKLNRYYAALDAGRLPIERGFQVTADDLIRRDVIQSIMCNFFVDFTNIEQTYSIDAREYFGAEFNELNDLVKAGFVSLNGTTLTVTETGQLFVRNIAMAFDAYLRKARAKQARFSRTV